MGNIKRRVNIILTEDVSDGMTVRMTHDECVVYRTVSLIGSGIMEFISGVATTVKDNTTSVNDKVIFIKEPLFVSGVRREGYDEALQADISSIPEVKLSKGYVYLSYDGNGEPYMFEAIIGERTMDFTIIDNIETPQILLTLDKGINPKEIIKRVAHSLDTTAVIPGNGSEPDKPIGMLSDKTKMMGAKKTVIYHGVPVNIVSTIFKAGGEYKLRITATLAYSAGTADVVRSAITAIRSVI